MTLPQLRFLRLEHCDVAKVETSETSTLCIETGQMSVLATEEMFAVETRQMSSVETGQMSAAETGQMSSVARTDICLVSTHNVDVSEVSTVAMSQCSRLSLRGLNCGNITLFKSQKSQLYKSQIGGLALNRRKWPEMGPEWSPGPENRSLGFSRPFSRLLDRSRGPNPQNSPNSRSTARGGRYL